MSDRRDFIKSMLAVAAISTLDVEKIIANPLTATTPPVLRLTKGMAIHDIIIGFWGTPADIAWRVRFHRESARRKELMPILSVPMNQRATFRWVAAPGSEIVLKSDERLVPYSEYYDFMEGRPISEHLPAEPIITMLGHDLADGRLIINQGWYA